MQQFTAKKGNFTPTPSAPTPCKASRQKTSPGSQPLPRILQNLWGSTGGFCGTFCIAQNMLKNPHKEQNFGSHWPKPNFSDPEQILLPNLGNEKSARSFSARSFFAPPGVMDVRAFGSWISAPKCLFFQGFEGLPEVSDPGLPREIAPGRPRDIRPENFLFACFFVPENRDPHQHAPKFAKSTFCAYEFLKQEHIN